MINQLLTEEVLDDTEKELTESVVIAADEKAEELDLDPQLWAALKGCVEPLRLHHPPTFRHSYRSAFYAEAVAAWNGKTLAERQLVFTGTTGHDAGKKRIHRRFLVYSPGEYDPIHDRNRQKVHARYGYEILGEDPRLTAQALMSGLHHSFELPTAEEPARSYAIETDHLGIEPATLAEITWLTRDLSIGDKFEAISRNNGRFRELSEIADFMRADIEQHYPGQSSEVLAVLDEVRASSSIMQEPGSISLGRLGLVACHSGLHN
jgi:hypothetical protein